MRSVPSIESGRIGVGVVGPGLSDFQAGPWRRDFFFFPNISRFCLSLALGCCQGRYQEPKHPAAVPPEACGQR